MQSPRVLPSSLKSKHQPTTPPQASRYFLLAVLLTLSRYHLALQKYKPSKQSTFQFQNLIILEEEKREQIFEILLLFRKKLYWQPLGLSRIILPIVSRWCVCFHCNAESSQGLGKGRIRQVFRR